MLERAAGINPLGWFLNINKWGCFRLVLYDMGAKIVHFDKKSNFIIMNYSILTLLDIFKCKF